MPLSTGQVINGRYRIVKLLGQGGFGAVYRAWDTNLNIPVALKENFDVSPASARQFALEANLLGSLRHPNLPKVTDHFILPDQGQYLVMEYVDGEDLAEKVEHAGGPLPESQALKWADQIIDALTYLHLLQNPPIIHRDIKPDNIRITSQGQAILVDFGIAKQVTPGQRTATAARAVTSGYSPIENYGQGPTDTRSDLYSLGATLYSVLTGQVPPDSIERMTGKPLPPPRQINPRISPQVEAAILKAMQLQPQNRFGSVQEFADALHRQPAEPAPLVQTSSPVRPTQVVASATQAMPPAYPTAGPQPDFGYPSLETQAKKPAALPKILLASGGAFALVLLAVAALILWLLYSGTNPPATPNSTGAAVLPAVTVAAPTHTSPPSALPPTNPPPAQDVPGSNPPTQIPPTPVPLPTDVPPPSGPLMLLLDTGHHCRGGPEDGYELLRDLNAGTRLELIGRSADGFWYLVRLNDPATRKELCWVSGGQVQGDPGALPVCTWTGDGYTDNSSCSP